MPDAQSPKRRWPAVAAGSIVSVIATLGVLLLISGCASKQVRSYYADDYLQALEQFRGTDDPAMLNNAVQRFQATLGDFTQDGLRERVEQLYADELYFNDTFKTFTAIEPLADYLHETGEMVTASKVEILGHSIDGEDLFIRWVMNFDFSAGGKDIQSRSLGMTHVRLNADGQVIVHQDFWDSTDGFFSHLPLVGGFVHRIREGL